MLEESLIQLIIVKLYQDGIINELQQHWLFSNISSSEDEEIKLYSEFVQKVVEIAYLAEADVAPVVLYGRFPIESQLMHLKFLVPLIFIVCSYCFVIRFILYIFHINAFCSFP